MSNVGTLTDGVIIAFLFVNNVHLHTRAHTHIQSEPDLRMLGNIKIVLIYGFLLQITIEKV